jgi:hypothetical protein
MSTQALHLEEPAVAGLASPNFFNGRLLTGEDLAAEQAAGRAAHEALARLQGPGVSHGLDVTLEDTGASGVPALRVAAGAAVTAAGELLALESSVRLELRRTPPPQGSATSAFAECTPAGPVAAGQAQLHLVTIAPAAPAALGRARIVGLGDEPAPCAVDRLAPAVRFELRPFAVPLPPGAATRLRNHVAALLLGDIGDAATPLAEAPTSPAGDGLLERLRGSGYAADEVPLAVVRWPSAAEGIEFVDQWAARRRCHQAGAYPPLAVTAAERRAVIAEARLAQFQTQLAPLASGLRVRRVLARDHFVSLPPAFVLPARIQRLIRQPVLDVGPTPFVTRAPIGMRPLPFSFGGFDPAEFLGGLTVRREAWVEGARVGELLAAATQHPAVDATASPSEALWFHPIRRPGAGFQSAQHVLVVSGHVRYAANAQYDLAHYDQANYAVPTT